MDISLGNRNEVTKRFNFVTGDDGDVAFDDTEAHAVMTSVIEHKEGYWADPTHGTEIYKLKNLTSKTPSQAESMALDGLLPLENANAIVSAQASAARAVQPNGLAGISLDLSWKTPSGVAGRESTDV